jgi:hypothetical protein
MHRKGSSVPERAGDDLCSRLEFASWVLQPCLWAHRRNSCEPPALCGLSIVYLVSPWQYPEDDIRVATRYPLLSWPRRTPAPLCVQRSPLRMALRWTATTRGEYIC